MYAGISPFEPVPASTARVAADAPARQRSRGEVRVAFAADGEGGTDGGVNGNDGDDGEGGGWGDGRAPTRLARLYHAGAARALFPRPLRPGRPEAVLLNTAGGLTGGDRMAIDVTWGAQSAAAVTTQAAEKIYRAGDGDARIDTRLTVGDGARADWLPQETILFDNARLSRTTTIDAAPGARVLAAEALVLGRAAMGETITATAVSDRWRVSRGGRLVFADALRLDRDLARALAGGACLAGHRALATVLYLAPDAEARLDGARDALGANGEAGTAGASAWDGLLVARLLAPDGLTLRRRLATLLAWLSDSPLPRIWWT